MLTGKNYIGEYLYGLNSYTFPVSLEIDNKKETYNFHEATTPEIDKAVSLAAQSFDVYRNTPASARIALLETIAEAIGQSKDLLVKIAMQETFLPQGRLEGEVQRTINQIKLFATLLKDGTWVRAVIDTAQPDRKPLPKPDIRQMQIPIGPVAIFGASNFPFAFSVAGGDTISALAAGCPVVYKAHHAHPATSELVSKIIIDTVVKCKMPNGIYSLLQGKTNACSVSLVTHPLIKAVAFTGSYNGGRALFDAAAKRPEPVPVYAEMGSVNPVFLLPACLEKDASSVAEKLAASNLQNAGQFCTNPGLIFLVRSAKTENFLSGFANAIKNSGAERMLSENICNNYNASIKSLLVSESARLRSYGKEVESEKSAVAHMFQTDAKTFLANKELWHEVFGPASIHVIAEDENELKAIAKSLQGQLTVSMWALEADMQLAGELANILELKAGRVIMNNVPTGVEVTHAMIHGGPFPATTDSRTTSVGSSAIYRFTRGVCYQNFPDALLPEALKNDNPLNISRQVNGKISGEKIE